MGNKEDIKNLAVMRGFFVDINNYLIDALSLLSNTHALKQRIDHTLISSSVYWRSDRSVIFFPATCVVNAVAISLKLLISLGSDPSLGSSRVYAWIVVISSLAVYGGTTMQATPWNADTNSSRKVSNLLAWCASKKQVIWLCGYFSVNAASVLFISSGWCP